MHHPKIAQRTDVHSLTVTGYGPFPWQVDGDYLGDTEHLTISCDARRARRSSCRRDARHESSTRRATSGTSVMMASTPAAASRRISSSPFTVHTLTASPSSCATRDRRAGGVAGEGAHVGMDGAVAVRVRDVDPSTRVHADERQEAGRDGTVEVAHAVDRTRG